MIFCKKKKKKPIRFEHIHTPSLIKFAYALNVLKHIF